MTQRGTATRERVQQVALDLFTRQGYEATSLREIAEAVGINKASLYYYFPSKEAILQSLFDDRGTEVEHLLAWLREQPQTPELLEDAVLRWVGTFTVEKLRATRFMNANPLLTRTLSDANGNRIGGSLRAFADELVGLPPALGPEDALLVRMAILSINAAVQAAAHAPDAGDSGDAADAHIVAAAHRAARALVREVRAAR
ncbi:TetR/AcrR family transcriptional regulator [Curtobacterium sp. ISL-83]|uniref:TetR/AcrR family transcriptional regulator n=1 Tax=Curtobacterium sp. ISL-83 TaxID=2819145 RepID=UPI001BE69154|nr:TetR/AcrR family transcriptional regulator [Curtobacterium sp. ISL-83]MBT2503449.1 TetR/AcrR family transcriptional regulator [Curtobacterium sp. ISL-83]